MDNPEKIVGYGEFIRQNPNATRKERIKAIKEFYEKLLKNED